MKKSRSNRAIIALTVILIASVTAVGFMKSNAKKSKDSTMYYWFDSYGDYLWRQSTLDDEILYTGFDIYPYAPFTLQEKGYAPSGVTGSNPPVPIMPYLPNRKLYSHP